MASKKKKKNAWGIYEEDKQDIIDLGKPKTTGINYITQGVNGINGLGEFSSNGKNFVNQGLAGINGLGEFSSNGVNFINQGNQGLANLGEFGSQYTDLFGNAIKDYANMGKFEYNLAGDPLFNQYKDTYTQQGKTAMQDTMGQAAALTGGYGNSYATAAGQQAYNSYMSELNNRIPELYSLALQNYNTEAARLQNIANMYGDAVNQDLNIYNSNRGYYGDLISGGSSLVNADATVYGTKLDKYGQLISGGSALHNAELGEYNAKLDKYGQLISGGSALASAENSNYNSTLNYLTNVAGMSYDEAKYISDTLYAKERDEVADTQWNKSYKLQKDQFNWEKSPDNPSNQKTYSTQNYTPQYAADGTVVPAGYTAYNPEGFSYTGNISRVVNSDGTITYTDANGKSRKVEAGTNPFTGNTNSRVMTNGEYDPSKAISSKYGYMPNTAPNGKEISSLKDSSGNKVKATFEIYDSNDNYWGDNTQTIWKTYKSGRGHNKSYDYWTWDVTKNDYVRVEKVDGKWQIV